MIAGKATEEQQRHAQSDRQLEGHGEEDVG